MLPGAKSRTGWRPEGTGHKQKTLSPRWQGSNDKQTLWTTLSSLGQVSLAGSLKSPRNNRGWYDYKNYEQTLTRPVIFFSVLSTLFLLLYTFRGHFPVAYNTKEYKPPVLIPSLFANLWHSSNIWIYHISKSCRNGTPTSAPNFLTCKPLRLGKFWRSAASYLRRSICPLFLLCQNSAHLRAKKCIFP